MTETIERQFAAKFAAEGKRLRVGCWACDFVGDIDLEHLSARPTEDQLHGWYCPECDQVGAMHHYPIAGTWPSDYEDNKCPLADADG